MNRAYCLDTGKISFDAARAADGSITGRAYVTKIGVFDYQDPITGRMVPTLRHPKDVFAKASLDTLARIPFQVDHVAMLDAANMAQYKVGNGGSDVCVEGEYVGVDFVIDAAAGIAAVDAGKQELSCGYWRTLIDEVGTYDGVPYEKRQIDIQYNHVAICDQARLGPELRIAAGDSSFDSVKPIWFRAEKDSHTSPENTMTVKVTLKNGASYDATQEVDLELKRLYKAEDAAVSKAESDAKEIADLKSKLAAEGDLKKAAEDALKVEKDGFDAKMASAVKVRAALLTLAQDNLTDTEIAALDSMKDQDIKTAIVKTWKPALDLIGKDAVYIEAMFDAAKADLTASEDAAEETRKALGTGGSSDTGSAANADKEAKDALTSLYTKNRRKAA